MQVTARYHEKRRISSVSDEVVNIPFYHRGNHRTLLMTRCLDMARLQSLKSWWSTMWRRTTTQLETQNQKSQHMTTQCTPSWSRGLDNLLLPVPVLKFDVKGVNTAWDNWRLRCPGFISRWGWCQFDAKLQHYSWYTVELVVAMPPGGEFGQPIAMAPLWNDRPLRRDSESMPLPYPS